ncbi:MAG: imelysin family protein [Pseudomonadota bacterium]
MKRYTIIPTVLLSAACLQAHAMSSAPSQRAVVDHAAELALAVYGDSLSSAQTLSGAIDAFLAAPSADSLTAAREAWIASRVPYQQTETFRFGNPWVDDWEGKVNAWPLDEGLIDYIAGDGASDDNPYGGLNIIANANPTIGGQQIDASAITPALLGDTLQELDGIESNVATGYHAIEFLLWGQDLNGTQPGAGAREASDFALDNCTNAPCDRRRDYLQAATNLLLSDLQDAVDAWSDGGDARAALTSLDDNAAVAALFTGMGSLAYGELAGERINLGLQLHDPEEEHDCFSDNTHASHYNDLVGIQNLYTGTYERIDGSTLEGPSIADLVAASDERTAALMTQRFEQANGAMLAMVDSASTGNAFDVLIGEGNAEGNAVVRTVVESLVDLTRAIERSATRLGVSGMDTLDSDALSEF